MDTKLQIKGGNNKKAIENGQEDALSKMYKGQKGGSGAMTKYSENETRDLIRQGKKMVDISKPDEKSAYDLYCTPHSLSRAQQAPKKVNAIGYKKKF